jgi:hypothetical protein
MKKTLIAALAAVTVSTGCSTQQVGEFARALQTNGPAPATGQVVQPPQQPKAPPVSLVSAGTLNQCGTEVSPNRDALLVTAGHNAANQFFTCAVGSPLRIGRAEAGFNATLISLLCDMSKPIVNTRIDEDASVINCTYIGPRNLPRVVGGLPIKAI